MSNNVTRKGLAFGALVALTSTAIAGAPAMAAGEINLVPGAGTSFNTIAGEKFVLEASFAPGYAPAAAAQLKYQITTDGSAINATASTVSYADAATTTTVNRSLNSSNVAVVASGRTANTDRSFLTIDMAAGSTESVEVVAFADADNDNVLDLGEWSTSKTVGFKRPAEISPVVTLDAPVNGDTALKASVAWGDLNVSQLAEVVTFGVDTQSPFSGDGSLNSTSGKYELAYNTGLVTNQTLSAQAKIGSNNVGTAVTALVTARTIRDTNGLVANITKGANATGTSVTTTAATTGAVVRLNGAFEATVKVFNRATTAAALPNTAVTGTVSTDANLRAASTGVTEISITVNGTKYTSNTALNNASFALTSDANGVAKLAISSAGLTAGQKITSSFAAQNVTASVEAVQTAAVYTASNADDTTVVATNKNTPVTIALDVKDQFGVASALTTQRVTLTSTYSTSATASQAVAVVGGKASVTVAPAADSSSTLVLTWALQNSTDGGVTWSSGGTVGASVPTSIIIRSSAYAFTITGAPAINASTGINGGAWTAAGGQKQTITQVDQSNTAATGYVAPAASTTWAQIDFTGTNIGEKITVSGTDVFLAIADSNGVVGDVAKNSASRVLPTAGGKVYVASNTVGTKTITVAAGSVSKTVDVVFASAATVASGANFDATSVEATAAKFDVAVASAAQSGRSIDATVTVTDKFGNPVAGFDVIASVAGVAAVNGGFSANVTTDANGKAVVKLTAGLNDLGDAVITFSDNDTQTGTATGQLANVTAVAKTVTFGQTDGYIDVLNGKRASVTWSMAKGKRVAFLLNGVRKYNFVQTGDAELNLQFNLKKGTNNIKLIIGGQIVDDLTVNITK